MRPIRLFESDKLYFITNRTIQGRFLLRPSEHINSLIGGVLARSRSLFRVQLFSFTFASNHFHLIIRAEEGELSAFMGYLQSNLARVIGREVGWRGPFWERRFSAEPILDDEALLDRFCYILSHGVKEGLVARSEEWPGLTCIPELRDGIKRKFPWTSWAARSLARLRGKNLEEAEKAATTYYDLQLEQLPCWEGLSSEEQALKVQTMLDAIAHHAEHERQNAPPLGARKILTQDPHSSPIELKRSPRPLCHAKCPKLRAQFKLLYRCFVEAYQEASELFRNGHADVEFPLYSFRPSPPYGWMLAGNV